MGTLHSENCWSIVVRTLILRFGIDLGEALSCFLHSLSRILEWEVAPRHVISSESLKIGNALGARSTIKSFSSKHGIILISFTFERHEKIIQILEVLLK